MLDLNWLLGLLGLGEKGAPISVSTKTWLRILLLAIVIGIWWLLFQLAEDRETNSNVNEDDDDDEDEMGELDHPSDEIDHFIQYQQGEQEHINGELDHHFREDDGHPTAAPGNNGGRRCGGCAFCGNLSTTRCSRCKDARYCSLKCQIAHWRSGHKYECSESETAANEAKPTDDPGTSKHVKKSEMESTSNGPNVDDGLEWSPESNVGVAISKANGCEICGSPSTTRCSRCNSVKYCSVKCLIMDWKWHKQHCIARDVYSAPIERPNRDVGVLKYSHAEEEKIHASGPLSLEFHPEGTTSFNSAIEVSQGSTTKVLYLEDEVAKSRNEILLLQSELYEWKNRANFAREKFQSLKRESNYQLLVLKKENESISDAEKNASNVIFSLHERLKHLQNAVQESIVEKRKLEEHIKNLESERVEQKKELQDEHKRAQRLTMESDKSREAAQIAMREVEAVRQELQEEREHAQRLEENFRRDAIFAESRAVYAEAKLSDLYRKIRMSDYKVCSICLSNDKDLAFGCGHMTCRDCGSKLSKCPICREQITNLIKLFPG